MKGKQEVKEEEVREGGQALLERATQTLPASAIMIKERSKSILDSLFLSFNLSLSPRPR